MRGTLTATAIAVLGLFAACGDDFETPAGDGDSGTDGSTGGSSGTGGTAGTGNASGTGGGDVDASEGGACEAGLTSCDGACIDTETDKDHCGSCETKCGTMCLASQCNDPIDITAGLFHTCALLEDGSVWCWGGNNDGQLGVGDVTDRKEPTKVALPLPATKVAAGLGFGLGTGEVASSTCAILSDKTLYCWGKNNRGQLGTGDTMDTEVPKAALLTDVTQVALSGQHTCATRSNKDLYCWGWNKDGQLGDGTTVDKPTPTKVGSFVDSVDLGFHHTCTVESTTVYCWGDNSFGQLGDGTQNDSLSPKNVLGVPQATGVSAGNLYTCATTTTDASCWGGNDLGELGNGTVDGSLSPQTLSPTGFTLIRAGHNTSGGIANGNLFMWGDNANGALGDNTQANSMVPKQISLPGVTNLALGLAHSCALTNGGEVFCWGAFIAESTDGGLPSPHLIPALVQWPQ